MSSRTIPRIEWARRMNSDILTWPANGAIKKEDRDDGAYKPSKKLGDSDFQPWEACSRGALGS